MTDAREIATLPPIAELRGDVERSERTGEPRRPALVLIALIVWLLAALGVAVAYGHHWWLAAHPQTYPRSAWLIGWVAPPPGQWLSLTLEACLTAAALLAAGAAGVAGFQAWNGWRWSRWAGLVAAALVGGFLAITSPWGIPAAALAVVGAILLFLPAVSRYFREQDRARSEHPSPYRRPERIVYGRLPRFR